MTTTSKKAKGPEAARSGRKDVKLAKDPTRAVDVLAGKRVAFFGGLSMWPSYHRGGPEVIAARMGALVVPSVDADLDVLVLGDRRGPGRAEAKKKAEKLAAKCGRPKIFDEAAFRELVRIDLTEKRFAFAGGFDCSPDEENDRLLARMIEAVGGIVDAEVTARLDYLVRGNRKGERKIARLNLAEKLNADGTGIAIIEEHELLELVRSDAPAASGGGHDFASFMGQLYGAVDNGKLGRALQMLKGGSFKLYTKIDDVRLVGVVRSQSRGESVYAPWLQADGRYGCCDQGLSDCMGLQGQVCKHLLVLVVGLVRTGQMSPDHALAWLKEARKKSPKANADLCAETLIQYKGAEAGTVDWRPTETMPEDFMAL